MKYRRLGRSGLEVSEIGFGTWGIGGRTEGLTSYGDTDDGISLAALRRALELGINFFDTSAAYGNSETLIGEAFGGHRDEVLIATKAGITAWSEPPDFSPAALVASLEASLRRLRTEYVDLFQLHNPPPDILRDPEVRDTLAALVRQGKARTWGLSMRSPDEALSALARAEAPVLQVNLNMMDVRAAEAGLLDIARQREIGIIARTPLCFGFLSGGIRPDTTFPPGDHRRAWPQPQIKCWIEGAREVLAAAELGPDTSKTQTALRFCLSFPAVSTVIAGMMRPEEVEENAGASNFGTLPPAARDAVLAINRTRVFFVKQPSGR